MTKKNTEQAWEDFNKTMAQLQKKQLETLQKFSQRMADRKIRQLQEKIK